MKDLYQITLCAAQLPKDKKGELLISEQQEDDFWDALTTLPRVLDLNYEGDLTVISLTLDLVGLSDAEAWELIRETRENISKIKETLFPGVWCSNA